MSVIENLLNQDDWLLRIEVDPNIGGDGTRVRLSGDPQSFRNLAAIMLAMADNVESQNLPASTPGWFLMFGGDMPQFELEGAAFLSLDCCRKLAE